MWGVAYAATHFSTDLRSDLRTLGIKSERLETAFEAFYNFAITPAIHLSLDAQYILDPFGAALGTEVSNHAFLLGSRLQLDF